eukprot:TRINITY_DN6246_c3_g1_i1.p1 TRINITY_DN6246_c3_g1~~TRINITY_DN6246_c3_g1_i1.p1  ORF type:complete len:869 (+),score=74.49 TRINITY_DN6246_c3_g1_i1:108-2714(+)
MSDAGRELDAPDSGKDPFASFRSAVSVTSGPQETSTHGGRTDGSTAQLKDRRGSVRERARQHQIESQQRRVEDHKRLERRRSQADVRQRQTEEHIAMAKRGFSLLYWYSVLRPATLLAEQVRRSRAGNIILRNFIPVWRMRCRLRRQLTFARAYGQVPAPPEASALQRCPEFVCLPAPALERVHSNLQLVGFGKGEVIMEEDKVPPGVWLLSRGEVVEGEGMAATVHQPGSWIGSLSAGSTACPSGPARKFVAAGTSLCFFLSRQVFERIVADLPEQERQRVRSDLAAVSAERRIVWLRATRLPASTLGVTRLLADWPAELLSRLAAAAEPRACSAGEYLQHAGQQPAGIVVLVRGRADVVYVWESGADSKKSFEAQLHPGSVYCAEELLFLCERSRCDVVLGTEADAWVVPREQVLSVLKPEPRVFLSTKQLACSLRASRLSRPPLAVLSGRRSSLRGWPRRVLAALQEQMTPAVFDTTEIIVNRRSKCQAVFYVSRGVVEDSESRKYGAGDLVGLWEGLMKYAHTTDIRCAQLAELWYMPPDVFRKALSVEDWPEDTVESLIDQCSLWATSLGEYGMASKLRQYTLAAFAEEFLSVGVTRNRRHEPDSEKESRDKDASGTGFRVSIMRSQAGGKQVAYHPRAVTEHYDQQTASVVEQLREHLTAHPRPPPAKPQQVIDLDAVSSPGSRSVTASPNVDAFSVQDVLDYSSFSRLEGNSDSDWRKRVDRHGKVFWFNVKTLNETDTEPSELREKPRKKSKGAVLEAPSLKNTRQALEQLKQAESGKYTSLPSRGRPSLPSAPQQQRKSSTVRRSSGVGGSRRPSNASGTPSLTEFLPDPPPGRPSGHRRGSRRSSARESEGWSLPPIG